MALTDVESPLANLGATKSVLAAHGLQTKHALGQNFLVNDGVIKKIIKLAELNSSDCVLEVGPGIGTLTIPLLKHAGAVISVERDEDLPVVLADTCAPWAEHFTLLSMDALHVQLTDFGGTQPNKFVANLPYAVAATLILAYFERFESLQSATVMVQKEVADRIMAQKGSKDYGAYSVKLGMFAKPAGRFAVSAGNFFPPPRVESAVVRLDREMPCDVSGAPIDADLRVLTCRMADAAFATRRKTIANSFKTYLAGVQGPLKQLAPRLPELFCGAQIDPKRRGETLSAQEFIRLAQQAASMIQPTSE